MARYTVLAVLHVVDQSELSQACRDSSDAQKTGHSLPLRYYSILIGFAVNSLYEYCYTKFKIDTVSIYCH